MKPIVSLLTVPLFCSVVLTASPVQAQDLALLAESEFAVGRYADALVLFERRAATGDALAAEAAGQMLFYGSAVYGTTVAQDLRRAAVLLAQAARAGRPFARYLVERIQTPAAEPLGTDADYVPGPAGC